MRCLWKSEAATNRTVGFWGLTEPINISSYLKAELVSTLKAKYPPSSQHFTLPGGVWAWGLGHWLGGLLPRVRAPATEHGHHITHGAKEGAGRTAQAPAIWSTLPASKGTGQSRGACAFHPHRFQRYRMR